MKFHVSVSFSLLIDCVCMDTFHGTFSIIHLTLYALVALASYQNFTWAPQHSLEPGKSNTNFDRLPYWYFPKPLAFVILARFFCYLHLFYISIDQGTHLNHVFRLSGFCCKFFCLDIAGLTVLYDDAYRRGFWCVYAFHFNILNLFFIALLREVLTKLEMMLDQQKTIIGLLQLREAKLLDLGIE